MDENRKPIRTRELQWVRAGNVFLLKDEKSGESHSLDPISFLVWLQCDGKTSVEEIVDVFSVNGNRDIVKSAIMGILERLNKSKLIEWV